MTLTETGFQEVSDKFSTCISSIIFIQQCISMDFLEKYIDIDYVDNY